MYHPRLKGKYYDMGLHYGEILYKSGQKFNNYIELNSEQIKFGNEAIKVYEEILPDIMQEVKGLAEGSKTDYFKMATWLITMYGFGNIKGCTCFAFNDNDKIILCRNSDMYPELKKTSESVLYMPENGYKFLGNTTSFIQIEDGINECGLAVGINFLLTKNYKIGINTGFLIRAILEKCKNTEEAIKLIKSIPLCSTQNIIIADNEGNLSVVEASPNKVFVRKSKNYIVSTNHFVSTEMKDEFLKTEDNWYLTDDRYNTCIDSLKEKNKNVDFAIDLASGKKGFICQYNKKLNFDTLWSSIYDIKEMKIFRAEGNPSKTKYKDDSRLDWGIRKSNC
ncbi:MAG: C45 family autoproteolytic acyltransferase/hydrolase [Bacilli bacterium]|nr:C45 family autoproteolytic acyltransferase/hydrolase [Bacilli bacterium]